MKKGFFLVLILIFFAQVSLADMVLYGEAEYNVETALVEVRKNQQNKISPFVIKPHLLDVNRKENLTALLNGKVELKDRELALFSVGTYGVVYKNDPYHAYYYSNLGILEYVDVRSSKDYPYKSYQYDVSGNLVNMGLRISKRETYIYSPNGRLIAHWVGANGYDESGQIVMTRQFVE